MYLARQLSASCQALPKHRPVEEQNAQQELDFEPKRLRSNSPNTRKAGKRLYLRSASAREHLPAQNVASLQVFEAVVRAAGDMGPDRLGFRPKSTVKAPN